ILKAAPWWTPRKGLVALALCVAAALGGGLWTLLLKRRIASQTELIRQKVEREALLESQNREVVTNASDFIYTIDFDGRFITFNEAGERLTGYSKADAANLSIYDLLDERQSRRVKIVLERRRDTPNAVFETQIRRKDGTLCWVEASAGFIRRDGEAACAFGVLHDIDARKQVEAELLRAKEAAEENTRFKSGFLAT